MVIKLESFKVEECNCSDFELAISNISNRTKLAKSDTNSKVREIMYGVYYFLRKYNIDRNNLFNIEKQIDDIINTSNDYFDIGFLTKFKQEVINYELKYKNALNLLDNSHLTYFILSTNDYEIRNVSKNITNVLGYKDEDFTSGRVKFSDIIFKDDFKRVKNEFVKNVLVLNKNTFDREYRVIDKNGEVKYLSERIFIEYDEDNKPSRIYGYIINISGRKKEELKNDNYIKALNNSSIVQIIDKNGVIQFVNDLYREVSGDNRNLIGRKASMMGGRKYQDEAFWRELWDCVLSGKVWKGIIQNPIKGKRNKSYYTQTVITPFLNEKGEISQFIAIKTDITQVYELKNELDNQQQRLNKIINSTSQGFISVDEGLNLIDVNDSFCDMLGYEKNELIGKNVFDLLDEDNAKLVKDGAKKIKTTNNRTYDIEIIGKNGIKIPVLIKSTTLRDDKGNFVEAFSFITDIREQKENEKKLYEASIKDGLTGLYNRRKFDSDLKTIFNDIKSQKKGEFSLFIFDLDFFKDVNDRYGHDIGDKVLISIGELLNQSLGQNTKAYRIGGEEFAVIGENIDKNKLKELSDIFIAKLSQTDIDAGIESIKITVSGGITDFVYSNENTIETIDTIFKVADQLLYQAKSEGRNNIKVI